jgi:hypothetical protein
VIKLVVMKPTAAALATALANYADEMKHAPRSKQKLLTYSELIKRAGVSVPPIGIGQSQLGKILLALKSAGLPVGLTLLARPKSGNILDFSLGPWREVGIDASNQNAHLRAAVDFDWSTVEFRGVEE